MKQRYLYEALVSRAYGSQVFFIDAHSEEEANNIMKSGHTDGIYDENVEVTSISKLELIDVTTTDDYGSFPEDAPDHNA